MEPDPASEPNTNASRTSLRELAALFTRLGFTAFGGPAAHVAMLENEVVTRRRWLDRQHFLDVMAAVNFIPGPNSTEMVIHIGQLRAGTAGLFVAGACFITPAMLIILVLSWAYVQWGSMPQMTPALHGIAACIVAIIAFATWRFGQTALKDPFAWTIMPLVAIGDVLAAKSPQIQPEIVALILSAIAGAMWYSPRKGSGSTLLAIALPIGFWPDLLRMAAVLFKIGVTLFGSGYVLISYLQSNMVDQHGWLTQQQLLDAIAVGQFTPGPLLTTATFVGYLLGSTKFAGGTPGGVIGGIVATAAIFLPSFLLVWVFGPMLQRIRHNPLARGALNGMNAAVVGLMLIITLRLAVSSIYSTSAHGIDLLSILILMASLLALWRKINATWLIVVAGLLGWMSALNA